MFKYARASVCVFLQNLTFVSKWQTWVTINDISICFLLILEGFWDFFTEHNKHLMWDLCFCLLVIYFADIVSLVILRSNQRVRFVHS
jgi:amino acid permease